MEFVPVTDKDLIKELNKSKAIRNRIIQPMKTVEPTSALKTFGLSAVRAIPEAIGNVLMKFGGSTPEVMKEALPGDEHYEQGRMAHPIADIGGSMAGFGPLGVGESMALRSIPTVGRAFEAAAPSLIKRTALGAAEGAGIGTLHAPPGQEGEGMLWGGLLGGGIHGIGKGAYEAAPHFKKAIKNITDIETLKKHKETALHGHQEQQALINAIKSQYEEQGAGLSKPEGITRQINEKQSQMSALEPSSQIPEENTSNLLNWPTGEDEVPNAQTGKEMQLREMEHHLGKNQPKGVEFANELNTNLKQMKQHIQKNYYKPVEDYTSKNYVQLPRTVDIKQIDEQLRNLTSDPTFRDSPGFERFKEALIKSGKNTHDLVPADKFVQQWKETKQAASKAQRKGYAPGEPNQGYWQDQAASLKNLADQQLSILKEHLPKQYYDKLLEATKLWREEVTPFFGNEIAEQAKKLGRIDYPNIMERTRGSGKGQEKMRELIMSNPKLTRLAIGHSYAENPEGLLNIPENEQQFVNRSPHLQGMMERLKNHNRNIEIAKIQAKNYKTANKRTALAHTEIVEKQVERQKAIKKRAKLDKEIAELHNKRDKLKHELEVGKIKKSEFEKADQELNDTLKAKNRIKNALKIGAGLIGTGGVYKLTHNQG